MGVDDRDKPGHSSHSDNVVFRATTCTLLRRRGWADHPPERAAARCV